MILCYLYDNMLTSQLSLGWPEITITYIPQIKLLKTGYFAHGFCNGYCSFGLNRVPSNTGNKSKNISSPQHTMINSSTNTHTAASSTYCRLGDYLRCLQSEPQTLFILHTNIIVRVIRQKN